MTPVRLKRLRQLLWLYFWLLIFEGALRRWFLPALSSPLLLVRDPIALLAVIWAWPTLRKSPWRAWLDPLLCIGPLALLFAITVGHGDLPTALYGVRVLLLQLPLIFVFGIVFNRTDVIRLSWVAVALSIPMSILIVLQSNLPETHLLNVGTGGVGSAVFDGAGGRFRPPGTFSFINGVSLFFTLAIACFYAVLYGSPIRQKGRLLCALAGIALVVAVPVSISRSMLAGYIQVTTALILALFLSRTRILPVLSGLCGILLAVFIATSTPAFQQTFDSFVQRWEMAAAVEAADNNTVLSSGAGVFEKRVLSIFIQPLSNLESTPFLGGGIGLGSNVGSQRLTGSFVFLTGESSWESSLLELGLPLGLTFLIWRLSLGIWILRLALRASVQGNRLPLIFSGFSFLVVLNGQVSQPTGLGFLVLSAGLTLASLNLTAPTPESPLIFLPTQSRKSLVSVS